METSHCVCSVLSHWRGFRTGLNLYKWLWRVGTEKCETLINIKYDILGFKCKTRTVSFYVWAKKPTWYNCVNSFLKIKVLNSVFTHSWHNNIWNVLAELINLVTMLRKITVIALALVLFYKKCSKTVRFSVIQESIQINHYLSPSCHWPSGGH